MTPDLNVKNNKPEETERRKKNASADKDTLNDVDTKTTRQNHVGDGNGNGYRRHRTSHTENSSMENTQIPLLITTRKHFNNHVAIN